MKISKLLKYFAIGIAAIIVVFFGLVVLLSINQFEVINKSQVVARDVRLTLIPTNKVYELGDIAPDEHKDVSFFVLLHDGAAKYSAEIGGTKVIGGGLYVTPLIGWSCTLYLYGPDDNENKIECLGFH